VGWLQTIERIGRGFGKRAAMLRREAQQKLETCRTAVPVWIMPVARVAESFDFSEPRFDVVIIDEASQCDVMALLAVALAREVVVVGDDKQVSPLAIGQNQEIVDNLIRMHLHGIPNDKLYDGRMSIYDLAKQAFAGLICLSEHFRCVPDIIQFSHYLSYPGQLKPLRESASSTLLPHVVPYRANGVFDSRRKTNAEEARTIASLVAAAVEHESYAGKSFGVISLLGDEQAIEIERLLLQHLSPEEYRRRRIICGNAAQFQGDERDVMFLSVVHASEDGPLRLSNLPQTQQRFNVAASRARDQMWVVYSLDASVDLKPGDLRRRLIEHALDPQAVTRALEKEAPRTESPFERDVLQRLLARGYRVRPQWWVGRYRIDLVVEGGGKRLAVECDCDRYHPIEKLPDDMERQAILERLGWRFVRLRGTAYFRDPEGEMEKVFDRLSELGIPAEGSSEPPEAQTAASELLEQLNRRAAEIRDQWHTRDSMDRVANNGDRDRDDGASSRNGDDSLWAEAESEDNSDEGAAVVVIVEKGISGNSAATIAGPIIPGMDGQEPEVGIWRMTRGEFHRYKEKILPPGAIDRQAINREFAAAIRQAVSEGKQVAEATLRELGIGTTNSS
jgi:very-short-patch-repair endonuclease